MSVYEILQTRNLGDRAGGSIDPTEAADSFAGIVSLDEVNLASHTIEGMSVDGSVVMNGLDQNAIGSISIHSPEFKVFLEVTIRSSRRSGIRQPATIGRPHDSGPQLILSQKGHQDTLIRPSGSRYVQSIVLRDG